jgi:tRNA-intron endonuclease
MNRHVKLWICSKTKGVFDMAKVKKEKAKESVKSELLKERVVTENSDDAKDFYNQSRFGQLLANGKVQLSLIEAFYLMSRKKLEIFDGRKKNLSEEAFLTRARKHDKNFFVRYSVFKDIRDRGYVIKTALKFGADFRVYDRGVKPGEDHARWVVYPVHESSAMTWYEFAAKTRVAHSTRKRLMIGVVDDEGDVSYWEIKWTRP